MSDVPERVLSTPNPDPTVLTSAALYREVSTLRDLLTQRMDSLETSRDREASLSATRMDVLNRERTEQLAALRELLEEKIEALEKLVSQQFDLIERQRIEQKADTKTAVDAALQAQKEAVREQTTASALSIAKSETATTKQLEQQQVTTATAVGDLRRSIDELKERIGEVDRNARTAVSESSAALNTQIQTVATTANGTVQHTGGARERTDDIRLWILAIVAIVTLVFSIGLGLYAALKP